MTGAIGTVAALWRYPAASMCGETVESVDIDTGGGVGDRGWGVYAPGEATAGFAARGRKWRNLVQGPGHGSSNHRDGPTWASMATLSCLVRYRAAMP